VSIKNLNLCRHSSEGWNPALPPKKTARSTVHFLAAKTVALRATFWIPAFAGMTAFFSFLDNACGFVLRHPTFPPCATAPLRETLRLFSLTPRPQKKHRDFHRGVFVFGKRLFRFSIK
jgi:hypothetical protein